MHNAGSSAAAPLKAWRSADARRFGKPERPGWRRMLFTIIFEADTRPGLIFDVMLILAILASVGIVFLDSVEALRLSHHDVFHALEWGFTLLFTAEYLLRLACVDRPLKYALSFYGIIDLLSILPSYLAVLLPELNLLMDVRILRLLRVMRLFKLVSYLGESRLLLAALLASRRKIAVFVGSVFMLVVVLATVMYVVEGPAHGYTSIPMSIYWAIVTITTTGYGDIVPKTALGQGIAALVMLLGYGVLAVPTGIVTAEITAQAMQARLQGGSAGQEHTPAVCPGCAADGHTHDAVYCRLCGCTLAPEGSKPRSEDSARHYFRRGSG